MTNPFETLAASLNRFTDGLDNRLNNRSGASAERLADAMKGPVDRRKAIIIVALGLLFMSILPACNRITDGGKPKKEFFGEPGEEAVKLANERKQEEDKRWNEIKAFFGIKNTP